MIDYVFESNIPTVHRSSELIKVFGSFRFLNDIGAVVKIKKNIA